ncbi:hypothetical protein DTO166G4_3271 [Paecilomyces variotii]|nr:hypothetical protein DTO166G4_3271 [Paecilomyces variotii]KAJ9237658.1 hypothetical protein DTO166G5_3422 [Paecilomyces variotii]KAJ9359036.1 hypothetical protein DTO280E4_4899 [Paecilomyces variotii]KAJ9372806.1 hypothetical protein DTO282E5_2533 [Paecilomyces variotii]
MRSFTGARASNPAFFSDFSIPYTRFWIIPGSATLLSGTNSILFSNYSPYLFSTQFSILPVPFAVLTMAGPS